MRRLIQVGISLLVLGGAAGALHGCGSSNNDQGVSFTAIGYNTFDENRVCQPDTFTTGMSIPISMGTTGETLVNSGQAVYSCINLQNNMTTMFIRTDRVFHEFFIEGASAQPPSSSAPLSIVLGPGKGSDAAGLQGSPSSSLPPGMTNANSMSAPFIAIPAEIMEWISLNREALPEPPFTMGVTHYVSGVTSSGDRLNSNPLTMFVVVTPDVIIPPAETTPEATVTPETTATPTA